MPLSELPGKVTFADGTDCEIVRLQLQPDGLRMFYRPGTHLGYLGFELGDENGEPLSNDVIGHSANTGSISEGLLGYGCYWTAEYKGQYVSMLTEEELTRAETLLIIHYEGLTEFRLRPRVHRAPFPLKFFQKNTNQMHPERITRPGFVI